MHGVSKLLNYDQNHSQNHSITVKSFTECRNYSFIIIIVHKITQLRSKSFTKQLNCSQIIHRMSEL
ncbi:hypothetical protein Hanom_Chr07g00590321 [Helianthus anomalus]